MIKHRITAITIALALGLPAAAQAKPVYDNGLIRATPKSAIKKASAPAATGGCRATV